MSNSKFYILLTELRPFRHRPKFFPRWFRRSPDSSEILSNYFKNKSQGVPEILPNDILQKQDTRSPRFFKNTSRARQGIPKILSNYFKAPTSKTRYKGSPRFFQTTYLLQKDNTRFLRFFQTTHFKNKARGSRGCLKLLHNKTRDPEDSLNYFKNKTKQKRHPRFFQTISKTKHKGSPRIF